MKIKEIGPRRGGGVPGTPLRSATVSSYQGRGRAGEGSGSGLRKGLQTRVFFLGMTWSRRRGQGACPIASWVEELETVYTKAKRTSKLQLYVPL